MLYEGRSLGTVVFFTDSSKTQTHNKTSQESESSHYLQQMDECVKMLMEGQIDPKYHEVIVQQVLDADYHKTRYPEIEKYCNYFVQEGFCYYVPS